MVAICLTYDGQTNLNSNTPMSPGYRCNGVSVAHDTTEEGESVSEAEAQLGTSRPTTLSQWRRNGWWPNCLVTRSATLSCVLICWSSRRSCSTQSCIANILMSMWRVCFVDCPALATRMVPWLSSKITVVSVAVHPRCPGWMGCRESYNQHWQHKRVQPQ